MKFTLSWLKDYLETSASLGEICQTLTAIGLEVEEVDDKAKRYQDFTVAQIISATPHENSNKLKICQVQTALQKEPLQVICGAKNARDGLKVAFAKIGAIIPANDMAIKKAKIAGIESNGMLCSAQELSLGQDDEGIIEIDQKWSVGTQISEIYGLNEAVFEINVTPNRGDCLGVFGVARDLAAFGLGELKKPIFDDINKKQIFSKKVNNTAIEDCCSISFCEILDVKNCQSPNWLKDRLEAVGINSISAIVDVTNYVMLCLNQPMHVYDADKVEGNLQVRLAQKDEKFTTLKDQEIKLDDNSLVIADDKKNLALAGIIGGKNSTCELETANIILEAACFSSSSIARTGRKFNILSDSRYRFERGVDINGQELAIKMASKLITDICGGKASQISLNLAQKQESKIINFNISDFGKIIGFDIDLKIATKILQNLGFKVKQNSTNLEVIVPSWRGDVSYWQDVVEEIIRICGYNKIKNQPFIVDKNIVQNLDIIDQAKARLANLGFVEIISWSFIDANLATNFGEICKNLLIANPISSEMDYLRPNLIYGLLKSFKNNDLRGISDLSLFEVGNVFDENLKQQQVIAGIRVGKNKPESRFLESRNFDVFDVKKDIADLLNLWGLKIENLQIDDSNPKSYYHPYRFAEIRLGKNTIGYFGELHSLLLKKFDIVQKVNVFEIMIEKLPISKNKSIKPFIVSDFQAVERDFAFIIDQDMAVGNLINDVYKIDKNLVKEVILFDIYQGDKIAKDKKSIAFRVKIQSLEKTLNSQEIDSIASEINKVLEQKYQAKLRS